MISEDIIMMPCRVNLRVSQAVNSTFVVFLGLFVFVQIAWCSAHRRTLGSFSESLQRSSAAPITKQNTQNWFPWQRGEPNLEELEVNTAQPVNTHGHTYSQAQWHSVAPTSRCCKCQKTGFDIYFTES